MKKIDLGNTVQVLANVGVIAGIVFLVIEIGQNTTSLRVAAYQDLIGEISALNQLKIEHPGPFALINDSDELYLSDLSETEWEEVVSIVLLIYRHGDMAHYQYENGLISDERLESMLSPVRNSACFPAYRQGWEIFRSGFVGDYRDFVDSLISSCE